jgi:predicted ATPase
MYYLSQISLPSGNERQFPFSLKALAELETMTFESPVTVFVGENGSEKSPLLGIYNPELLSSNL